MTQRSDLTATVKAEGQLLTYVEAAKLCSVDPTFIRKAVANRELRIVVLGPKTHRILDTELRRWWKARQTKGMITK